MFPSLKYPKVTLIITILIGGLSATYDDSTNWPKYYFIIAEILYCLAGVALHFTISLLFKYFNKIEVSISEKFDFNNTEFSEWFSNQRNKIFNNEYGILFALLITAIITYIIFETYTAIDGIDKVFFVIYSTFFFFQAGIAAFIFFMLVVFIWRIGNLEIKSKGLIFYDSEAQNISNIYLKFLTFGIILYFFSLLIIWFSPGKIFINYLIKDTSKFIPEDYKEFNQMLNLARSCIFCIALCALGFFILTQNFIHNILKKFKKRNIELLNSNYIATYQIWNENKTNENAETVNNVLKWIDYTNKQKEWAINLQTIAIFIGSIIAPISKDIFALFK